MSQLLPYIDILFGFVEEYRSLEKHVDLKNLFENSTNEEEKDNLIENVWRVLQAARGKENIILDGLKQSKTDITDKSKRPSDKVNGQPTICDVSEESTNVKNGSAKAKKFTRTNSSSWCKRQKLVIVTQGPNPLLYATNRSVRQRPVSPIEVKDIVDTTGAGDSFVGGFLAALCNGESLQRCLDCGTWTAQQILKQKGCTLPTYPASFLG